MFTALLMDAAPGLNQKKALSPGPADGAVVLRRAAGPGQSFSFICRWRHLLLLVPAARLGHHARAKKCALSGRLSGAGAAAEYGLLTDTLRSGQTAVQTICGGGRRTARSRAAPAEPDGSL